MKRIVITGGKGGTGKSTVATSLALIFSESKKTMLVDADAECPNDHILLSVKRKKYNDVNMPIPKWDMKKCIKCGKCAEACKQDAIVFVKDNYPAFVKDVCIGCQACIPACPTNAISLSKKKIGTVFIGKNFNVNLVSGELKLGELASGEVVTEVRKYAEIINKKIKAEIMLIDSSAGIGCPVIASLTNTDYIVAVTEPTPSALFDLKRIIYLAKHFEIPCGLIINKFDLSEKFVKKIFKYAKKENLQILGEIPYKKEIIDCLVENKSIFAINEEYKNLFKNIKDKIKSFI